MKIESLGLCFLLSVGLVFGIFGRVEAATPVDTVGTPPWIVEFVSTISGSQAAYKDWQEGGLNTLTVVAELSGEIKRLSENWKQTHHFRLAYGLAKQDTIEVRKAEDVVRLESSFQYRGDGVFGTLSPTMSAAARTQFAPGFNYAKNPFDDSRKPPVEVSSFFSPVILTQSLGLTYSPDFRIAQRLGVGTKETVVLNAPLRTLYGLRPQQATRFELGVDAQTEVNWEVVENVQYESTLGLFAAFNQPQKPDMLWENMIIMNVNRWLSVDIEVVALYDRDTSRALQVKERFSLGVSYDIM